MTRHNMVASIEEPLIRLPCDYWARSLCARSIDLGLRVRRMPKRRKAGSCAFKVRNPASDPRSTEADATTAGTNTTCDLSATMEATALKSAATEVTTTTKPTTIAVTGRPCYGTKRPM